MKASLFLASLLHATVAIAGGYQGCLEKIWLFKAYEIDGLNPAGQRTLGFGCVAWNDATKTCTNNNWEECGGRGGGRCDFGEFVHFLGRANNQNNWAVPATGDMDVVETAKNCVARYTNAAGRVRVYNAPPFKAMQGTIEYNDFIMKVSKVVEDTWKAGRHNDANKHMWTNFDSVREQIINARAGDHGAHLITRAQSVLGGSMTIQTQDLGENPMDRTMWKTVDWKETARTATVADADTAIRNFLKGFYAGGGTPREHQKVIQSYKRATDKSISCRMRP